MPNRCHLSKKMTSIRHILTTFSKKLDKLLLQHIMKKHIFLIIISIFLFNISAVFAQKSKKPSEKIASKNSTKASKKDFQILLGNWRGSLTYLDYSSNKSYTMPADVNISQVADSKTFIFSNIYPDEPKANSADTLVISKNGKMLNKKNVTSKRKLDDGIAEVILEIITEILSVDGNDNKPAIIRHTYLLGNNTYTKTEHVQFVGQNKWIKRNEYSYKRK